MGGACLGSAPLNLVPPRERTCKTCTTWAQAYVCVAAGDAKHINHQCRIWGEAPVGASLQLAPAAGLKEARVKAVQRDDVVVLLFPHLQCAQAGRCFKAR